MPGMSLGDLPGLFPDGRAAAISLTYDDGLPQHLDCAMPDLEAGDLRGTFYVATRRRGDLAWGPRVAEWKAAHRRGHEIGNHTQYHPCGGERPWLPPNLRLEAYNLARIEAELVAANREIDEALGDDPVRDNAVRDNAVRDSAVRDSGPGGRAPRSFAYTCCDDWVGPEQTSFRPVVARLFPAARGGVSPVPQDPYELDLAFVQSWAILASTSVEQIIAYIDRTVEDRRWGVLTFHGVGGGHNMNVSRDTHRAIVEAVVARSDRLWCDTFLNVARHLRAALRQA